MLLLLLFLIPFGAALISVLSGKNVKRLAFVLSLLPLGLLLDNHAAWIGSNVDYAWLPVLSIDFHLSVDALSLLFIYLTAIIVPISLFAGAAPDSPSQCILWLHLATAGIVDWIFCSARPRFLYTVLGSDLAAALFYHHHVGRIIPLCSALEIHCLYGGRLCAFGCSGLGIIFAPQTHLIWMRLATQTDPLWVALVFFLAFAVKTPLFPFPCVAS